MATVFLSYAREDSPRIRPLVAVLEKDGHTVWWDEQVAGGDQFTQAIQDALDKADAVVVAWSKASVQSAWVRDEAAHGRDSGKLVPVTIDGSMPPLGFREYQAIDLSSWSGRGSRQIGPLKKAIAAKAGRKPAEQRAEPAEVAPRRSRRGWLWAIAAAAAAAVAAVGLVATGVIDSPVAAPTEETPSIAVLPFADLSPARDKAYFAEGVAEEILSTLATEQGIRVLGRSSARQIERGGGPMDLRTKLGITHLLEGSARSAGDQLRVNVRLIDTSDGRQVWEEEYEGRVADIFAVQDQIAGAVVQRLRGTLSPHSVRVAPTTRVEVYQAYLAARALMRTRTERALQEALELAKRVVGNDPNYAPGHALLAELLYLLSDHYSAYGSMPLAKARHLAIPHAKQAIRLAPESAEGYAALGILEFADASIEPLQRAIKLDPSRGELRLWLGFSLNELGRHDDALAQYRSAVEIDPLGFAPNARRTYALAAAGQHQAALVTLQQFIERGGDEALRFPLLVQIYAWHGDLSSVVAYGRAGMKSGAMQRHDDFLRIFASALHATGFGKEAALVLPSGFRQFHSPHYAGDKARLRRNIDGIGSRIWTAKDGGFAFTHLAAVRDWAPLVRLYAQRPARQKEFCEQWWASASPFVLALRARGQPDESEPLLQCMRERLAVELRNKARRPEAWPGDLEFQRASLAALTGDRTGALQWLDRAVSRGWLGQPYSSRLTDYPQFDALRADARLAALQRRVDARIARERDELERESAG